MKTLTKLTAILISLSILMALAGCGKQDQDKLYTVSSRYMYSGDIVMDADDAYYFDPPIVLEQNGSGINLGEWRGPAKAYWGFTVPEEGTYDITIIYSRADGPEVRGYFEAEKRIGKNKWEDFAQLAFELPPTGEDSEDWSEYAEFWRSGIYDLPAETEMRLSMYPDDKLAGDEYFINLQSITLRKRENAPE